jgi:hypothetical protein
MRNSQTDDIVLRTTQETVSDSRRYLRRLQASQKLTKMVLHKSQLALQEGYAALERFRASMGEPKNS